jgi:hypothetical protein
MSPQKHEHPTRNEQHNIAAMALFDHYHGEIDTCCHTP